MRVFLSYGHDQYALLAGRLKQDLEARGHKVWFDVERLKPGGDWERYIEEGFELVSNDKDGGRFLLLMTPHSVRRPDGYCLNELARAYGRNLPITPVMVSTVEPPLSICRLQWLDMRQCFPAEQHEGQYGQRFEQLVVALTEKQIPFEGIQQRLLNYLQPITYADDLARHLSPFTGRDWLKAEVEEWLASTKRVLWITGEAGVGKSAVAAWLCDKRPEIVAYHFCHFGNADRIDARRALFSLAYQLSTQLPDYQNRLNASPLDKTVVEPNVPAVFDRLFVNLLTDAVPLSDKPRVVLIDALDEATRNGRNELASLIGGEFDRLPSWLRVIITSRPYEQEINSELQALDPWKLDAGREENLKDIRTYLYRELRTFTGKAAPSGEVVDKIVDKSEGLFLYVTLVREELQKGRLSLARLEELPQGLGAVYLQWFQRYFPDIVTYQSDCRPALEAICAAREPLPRNYLKEVMGWSDYRMDSLAERLGSLFPFVGEDERVRPVHQSVRDWLTDRKRSGAFRVDMHAGEQRLADFALQQYKNGVGLMSHYSVVHAPSHFAVCQRKTELKELLLDPDWLQAKLQATDINALLGDYDYSLDEPDLCIVQSTLRLSAHILAGNPQELPGQLLGRLPENLGQGIESLRQQAAAWRQFPWLRPVTPNLTRAGSSLVWTLAGHEDEVRRVEILRDNRRAISSALDGTLRIWDTKTGTELHTLRPSKGKIGAMVLTPDERRVICGLVRAWQLQMWDIEQGTELPTPRGATEPVVVTSDSRCAISEFVDLEGMTRNGGSTSTANTLKVWDLATGTVRFDLRGARFPVVMLPASNRAISASLGAALQVWDLSTGEEQPPLKMQGCVRQIYITPDERVAISVGSYPDAITIWDLTSRSTRHRLVTHPLGVNHGTAVAVTPDGRRAAFCGEDNNILVWDLDGPKERYQLAGHTSWLEKVFVTPNGHRAVSLSADSTRLWDLEGGNELRAITEKSSVLAWVTLPGRARVLFLTNGELRLWNVENGEELQRSQLQTDVSSHRYPNAVAVTPDGRFVVLGLEDRTLRVWDLAKNNGEVFVLGDHAAAITTVVALPGEHCIISGSKDGTLKVWDLARLEKPAKPKGHRQIVTAIAITLDGQRVVSVSQHPTVTFTSSLKVWDCESGNEVLTLTDHYWQVDALAVLSDGRRVVLAGGGPWVNSIDKTYPSEKDVLLWDLELGVEIGRLGGHSGSRVAGVAVTPDGRRAVSVVFDVALTPDGRRVVSPASYPDQTVCVWDVEQRVLLYTLPKRSYEYAGITPDGRKIITADRLEIAVWDVRHGIKLGSFYHADATAIAVMADSQHVVSATDQEELRVWDVESGEPCLTLRAHRWNPIVRQIQSVVITQDGNSLISPSPSEAGLLKLWNLKRKGESMDLGKHNAAITAVAVAKDGSRAVSASEDKSLKVWNLARRACISTFTTEQSLQCCAISPEGLTVAAGDSSGRVHIFRLN